MASEARNAGRYIIYGRVVDDFMIKNGKVISKYVSEQSKARKNDPDSVRNLDELTQAVSLDMIAQFPEAKGSLYSSLFRDMAHNIQFNARRA